MYLHSVTSKSEKVRLKEREIEKWISLRNLSERLQKEFKKYQPYKWKEIQYTDLSNNLLNLPKDLERNIKRELGLKQMNKVSSFPLLSLN